MPAMPATLSPGMMPPSPDVMPSFVSNAVLSKADVDMLKSTVDTFAGAYTSGSDPAKDQAAVGALRTGLESLSTQIWSETHVVGKDSVSKLQQAVDSFAASYTSGTNVAQDAAAWQSLKMELSSFWATIQTAGQPSFPLTMPPQPVMMPFGPFPVSSATVLGGLPALLSSGQTTLSKDNLSKLEQAVDTFAGDYTSGTDQAKDSSAVRSLEMTIDEIARSMWSVPTMWPMVGGSPAQTPPAPSQAVAPAGGSASSS
jgi:hypothetical protein